MTFTPTLFGTGIGGLAFLNQTRQQQETLLRSSAQVSRDVEATRDRLTKVQNVDELLDDRQLLRVVLGSFGLQEDIDNKGFLRGVLMSDLNDPRSAANRLSEPKYRELARTFNFGAATGANFPGASAADTLAPQLQALGSPSDLFEPQNSRLLSRALEVFGLEEDAGRTVFLQRLLESDLSDETSLVNRIGSQKHVDFVAAFQNDVDRLPEALRGKVSDDVASKLRSATSGADIVEDRRLLGAVLTQFGLEDQINNTSLIRGVLDSDLTDPKSMANRLTDPRLQELASAFNFAAREAESNTIYAFADLAKNNPDSLTSADSLLADDTLLTTSLTVFGIDPDDVDKAFLKTILEADPDDDTSVLYQEENSGYVAFSKAFGFGEAIANPTLTQETRVEKLIEAVDRRNGPAENVESFMQDIGLFLAATNLFDLPQGANTARNVERVLASDPEQPLSPYQIARDDNYRNLFNALNIQDQDEAYSYPSGFEEAIIDSYIERQFEIAVGEQDNDMRLMLSVERDLGDAVELSSTNDGRWFRVLGNPSLRAVFDAAFALPQSIGQLDLDRQLDIFKEKSEQVFGTSDLSELNTSENLAGLQRRYLLFAPLLAGTADTASSPVLSLVL